MRVARALLPNINKVGDDHLREAVRDVLAGGRKPDFQQVFQLNPRERTEISQGEAGNMLAEQDDEQYNHTNPASKSGGDGRAFRSQCRHSPFTENQGVIADDVHDVHQYGDQHGINGFVGTAQRGGYGERNGLEESECPHYFHIADTVLQQFGTESHPAQQGSRTEMENGTDRQSQDEVEQQSHTGHLHHVLVQSCSEILRAKHRGADVDNLEYQEGEGDNLVDHAYRRHALVGVLAQHNGVDRAQHHDEQGLDENGNYQLGKSLADTCRLRNSLFHVFLCLLFCR